MYASELAEVDAAANPTFILTMEIPVSTRTAWSTRHGPRVAASMPNRVDTAFGAERAITPKHALKDTLQAVDTGGLPA